MSVLLKNPENQYKIEPGFLVFIRNEKEEKSQQLLGWISK